MKDNSSSYESLENISLEDLIKEFLKFYCDGIKNGKYYCYLIDITKIELTEIVVVKQKKEPLDDSNNESTYVS